MLRCNRAGTSFASLPREFADSAVRRFKTDDVIVVLWVTLLLVANNNDWLGALCPVAEASATEVPRQFRLGLV